MSNYKYIPYHHRSASDRRVFGDFTECIASKRQVLVHTVSLDCTVMRELGHGQSAGLSLARLYNSEGPNHLY